MPDKPVNLPWVEKYRPKTLSDLISHTQIISTIDKFIREDSLPHMLFYGPPGTGKTSTILAAARKLYSAGEFQSMVLELNASDDRGIGVVRGQVHSFASTRTVFTPSRHKLVLLDEADAMTRDAQDALRRIIEKYTDNVRFCLICNFLGKITPAIQSRCMRFRFAPLQREQVLPRLNMVVEAERVNLSESGRQALLELCGGDMRRVLNILQSTWMSVSCGADRHSDARAAPCVDARAVYACVGQPHEADISVILNWMLNEDIATAFKQVEKLKVDKGLALQDIITELHKLTLRVDFPATVKCRVLVELSDVEHHLCRGGSEQLQLAAVVAMFQQAKHDTAHCQTNATQLAAS